jgi:coronin-1B/1C/6
VKEFKEEIRKLKAMIVKHENRIRTLEARAAEDVTDSVKDNGDSLIITNNDQNDVDTKDVDINDDD